VDENSGVGLRFGLIEPQLGQRWPLPKAPGVGDIYIYIYIYIGDHYEFRMKAFQMRDTHGCRPRCPLGISLLTWFLSYRGQHNC
jgi:hypothetical protein